MWAATIVLIPLAFALIGNRNADHVALAIESQIAPHIDRFSFFYLDERLEIGHVFLTIPLHLVLAMLLGSLWPRRGALGIVRDLQVVPDSEVTAIRAIVPWGLLISLLALTLSSGASHLMRSANASGYLLLPVVVFLPCSGFACCIITRRMRIGLLTRSMWATHMAMILLLVILCLCASPGGFMLCNLAWFAIAVWSFAMVSFDIHRCSAQ